MKITGDNYEIDLSQGKVHMNLYLREQGVSLNMTAKVPEQQSEETQGVLEKFSSILSVVKSKVDSVVQDFNKDEGA